MKIYIPCYYFFVSKLEIFHAEIKIQLHCNKIVKMAIENMLLT